MIKRKSGVSLMEICIVLTLASMIMTIAVIIMQRTTVHYRKGTELMNVQILMDTITEQIRNDVKGLRKLDYIKDKEFRFQIANTLSDNPNDPKNNIFITYSAQKSNEKSKHLTLIRKVKGANINNETTMRSGNQIKYIKFTQREKEPNSITMSMQLIADEKGDSKHTTMSFVCDFHSNCVDNGL